MKKVSLWLAGLLCLWVSVVAGEGIANDTCEDATCVRISSSTPVPIAAFGDTLSSEVTDCDRGLRSQLFPETASKIASKAILRILQTTDESEIEPETQQTSPAIPGSVGSQPAASPWPMFRGGPRHTGLSNYDTRHVDGTVQWSFRTGAGIESSPTIGVDGTIYVGSHDNTLYAVNSDGTEKWHFTVGDPEYLEDWNVWKGILSSPAIGEDGTIYFTSLSDLLFAINPDGTEKWRFTIPVTADTWSSPTLGPDGTIYVGSARKYSEGAKAETEVGGRIYAIHPDGSLKWEFPVESDVFPSPAIGGDGTIYCGTGADGKFYAINPDGTEKWRFQTGRHIESSAAIGSDGTIYFGSWDNNVYAINPDGTERWHFVTQGDGIVSSPAIARDGTIYVVANDNYLYALNPDGAEQWRLFIGGGIEQGSSPAIGADGTIYLGSMDYHIYAINPDGTVKWRLNPSPPQGSTIVSSPAIGVDGTVYIGSWDHSLYAIAGRSP